MAEREEPPHSAEAEEPSPRVYHLADRAPKSAPKSGGGWEMEWAEDFLARDFPPAEWLYLDLIPKSSTCVIIAPPNAGKTLLAFDVGAHIAATFAAREGPPGLRVAIVEKEGTGAAMQSRLRRAFAAAGPIPEHAVKVSWNSALELTANESLMELAAECQGAEVIILDSLADLTSTDENDPAEMKVLGKALRGLQRLTGSSPIALHHMTKEAWKPGEAPSLRHLRGHGALAAAVDTVLALVPGEEEQGKVNFDLYCLKQRDGERGPPRSVSISMSGPAATVEMRPLERKQKHEKESPEAQAESVKAKVLLYLRQRPDSGSGVSRHFHMNKQEALQACADLEADGLIKKEGKDWMPVPTVPTVPTEPVEPAHGNGSSGSNPYREPGTGTDRGTDARRGRNEAR